MDRPGAPTTELLGDWRARSFYQVRICLQKIMYGLKDSHLATQTIKIYMYQLVSLVTANYVMIIRARSNSIPQENTGVKEKPTYIYFLKLSSLKHVQLYFNKTKQNKTIMCSSVGQIF